MIPSEAQKRPGTSPGAGRWAANAKIQILSQRRQNCLSRRIGLKASWEFPHLPASQAIRYVFHKEPRASNTQTKLQTKVFIQKRQEMTSRQLISGMNTNTVTRGHSNYWASDNWKSLCQGRRFFESKTIKVDRGFCEINMEMLFSKKRTISFLGCSRFRRNVGLWSRAGWAIVVLHLQQLAKV